MLSLLFAVASRAHAEPRVFPPDAVVNVKTEFGAVGDGRTDDTEAIRRAIDETIMATLYFPDGTYLISDSVGLFNAKPHSDQRFRNLQGQSREGTVIRLKPNSPGFDDPDQPKVLLSLYDGQSTGDAMHSYVRDLTVSIGPGNPGAAALRFMTNNTGAVERVTITSEAPDGAGAIGLDLRQSQNGPGLIQDVAVHGFDFGVQLGNTFSMVFDNLELTDQNRVAFDNEVGRVTIHKLRTRGAPLAIRNGRHGHLTLVDAELTGGSGDSPAIRYESNKVFLRDVRHDGYAALVEGPDGSRGELNERGEFYPLPGYTLFDGAPVATLRLPIEPTPVVPWEQDLNKWIRVGDGTQEGKLGKDVTDELQAAIDEAARTGATTVYFPQGKYRIRGPIRVHGSVNRIIGMQTNLNFVPTPSTSSDGDSAVFVIDGLDGDTIVFERFFMFGGWERPDVCIFDNRDGAKVVIRNMSWTPSRLKRDRPGGTWFAEDVSGSRKGPWTFGRGERFFARQLNPEGPTEPLIVARDGATVWVLGLKTEGRVSHVVASNGAEVEVLGGVAYQSWKNQQLNPPMFDVSDSRLSATLGFYHWDRWHFDTIVEETRDGATETLPRRELENYHLPVFRAGPDRPSSR